MELTGWLLWNIFLTLVVAPILYSIRENTSEIKRLDILLNKTREEMAKKLKTTWLVCLIRWIRLKKNLTSFSRLNNEKE